MRAGNGIQRYCVPLIIMLACISLPFPGSTGAGLLGGHNLVVWACVVLWALMLLYTRSACAINRRLIGGVLLAAVMMTLPVLWTTVPAWRLNALPRLIGLWTGVMLFILLLRINFGLRGRAILVSILAVSALLQALIALSQLLFPLSFFVRGVLHYDVLSAQSRPIGSLGQVNLLGSFLAMGAGANLWCLLSLPVRRHSFRFCAWLSLTLIMAALVVTYSRTGWLGGLLACGGVFCLTGRYCHWRALAGCVFLGCVISIVVLTLQPRVIVAATHNVSPLAADTFSLDRMRGQSRERRLQMLRVTSALIKQHPFTGSGLGSFERRWSDGLVALNEVSATPERVIYPHNELLYVWVEGGAVALAGFLLICVLWMRPALSFVRKKYQRGVAAHYFSLWPLTLPLMLHTMTEFPFYLSALHFVLFLLLWRVTLPDGHGHESRVRGAWLGLPIGLFGFAILTVCALNFSQLRTVEKTGFSSPLILVMPRISSVMQGDRVQFDRCVNLLMAYNKPRDVRLLQAFVIEADSYLTAHNDPNLMDSLIRVDTALGLTEQAAQVHHRAQVSFPQDPRFTPQGLRP